MIKVIKDIRGLVDIILEKERRGRIIDSLLPAWKISDESYSLLRTGRTPVIVIQGYLMKRESMREIDNALKDAGFAPISFELKRLGKDKDLKTLASELRLFLEIFFKNNFNGTKKYARIPAIGFSMGGVLLHYVIRAMDGASFIDRLITIASPINGLKYAILAAPLKNIIRTLRSVYDLWEGSDFIRKLKKKPFPPSCYFVSISSEHDWMAPPESCRLPELPNTKNIFLSGMFHSDLPFSKKVKTLIMENLIELSYEKLIKYF